jgi:hypothetical protein
VVTFVIPIVSCRYFNRFGGIWTALVFWKYFFAVNFLVIHPSFTLVTNLPEERTKHTFGSGMILRWSAVRGCVGGHRNGNEAALRSCFPSSALKATADPSTTPSSHELLSIFHLIYT